MSQKKRHQQIITKLNIDGQVFVKELATSFGVTEDCIRKDLTLLEKAGKLKRVHGGAVNVRVNLHHTNVSERVELYSKEKKIIASKAVKELEKGYVIFLDISTINEPLIVIYDNREYFVTEKGKRTTECKKAYMVGESAKLNQDGNYAYASLDDFTGYICEKELDHSLVKVFKDHQVELI